LYQDVNGPVTEIAARPIYIDVTLEAGATFRLPIPEAHRAVAYAFEGQGIFGLGSAEGGTPVQSASMVVFGQGEALEVQAAAPAGVRFMLMAGAPIGEPIVPYGPFVMNTEAEIRQTLAELRSGTFVVESAI